MGYVSKLWLVGIMFLVCGGLPASAGANTLRETVIFADRGFNYFLGNSTGSNLRYIGGAYDWSVPQYFTETACLSGDYIYVAAWAGSSKMFIGQFRLPTNRLLLTKTTDWLSYKTANYRPGGVGPIATAQIQRDIAAATWTAPEDLGENGYNRPYFPSIDNKAHCIWHTPWNFNDDPKYVLFRSKGEIYTVAPTPIPGALPLFGSGLLLLGAWRAGRRFL